jgi:hypothetical protein
MLCYLTTQFQLHCLYGIEWNIYIEMIDEEVMIWKEEFVICLIVLSQKLDCWHWRKPWQTSIRIADNPALIQTWSRPNATSLEYY